MPHLKPKKDEAVVELAQRLMALIKDLRTKLNSRNLDNAGANWEKDNEPVTY